jgi:hypothetical protein
MEDQGSPRTVHQDDVAEPQRLANRLHGLIRASLQGVDSHHLGDDHVWSPASAPRATVKRGAGALQHEPPPIVRVAESAFHPHNGGAGRRLARRQDSSPRRAYLDGPTPFDVQLVDTTSVTSMITRTGTSSATVSSTPLRSASSSRVSLSQSGLSSTLSNVT